MTKADLKQQELINHIRKNVFGVYCDKVIIVQLKCINPTKKLSYGDFYWAYEDQGQKSSWHGSELYDVYKIVLPELGPRKYDPKRFKVIYKTILYKHESK